MQKLVHNGLKSYLLQDSKHRKQIVFARAWKELQKNRPDLLEKLLEKNPTQEDATNLATLIQWLGGDGFKWLEEIMKKCNGLIKVEV